MNDFKYKDEVVLYPYEPNTQIYYISMIYDHGAETYALKLVNGDGSLKHLIHDVRTMKHCTPEMKTKILLGIDLTE